MDVGRALFRLHGRPDAAREPADADRRTQPRLASRRDRCDPQEIPKWKDGNYTAQPQSLRVAAQMLWLVGSNPILRQTQAPTLADLDRVLDENVASYFKTGDANNILYALEASRDYDPGPGLEKIIAPLIAVNSADDIINPPELQILEHEIKRVTKGKAVVLPLSDKTTGHGTHTQAAMWNSTWKNCFASANDRHERW